MANRNRKDLSRSLFGKLASRLESVDLSNTGNRWISRLSEADAEFLSRAEVNALRLGRHLGSARMTAEGDTIIATVGLETEEAVLAGLIAVDATPATFQLTISELDLAPSASESEIRDVFEGRSDSEEDYSGHDLAEIQNLFPRIDYWQTNPNYKYTTDNRRVLGSIVCRSSFEIPLTCPRHLIEAFDETFVSGDDHLPYSLLVQALLASFWQTQFIEVYRCVEQLFPAEKVLNLSKKLKSKRRLGEINAFLVDSLNWRPHEESALKSLLENTSKEIVEDFRKALSIDTELESLRTTIAKRLYKLRNAIVHYRGASQELSISDNDWAEINTAMLKFANELYNRFGKTFFDDRS